MRAVTVLLGILCGSASLSPFGQEQKPIRHDVAVSLKLIQVYVTGKDGKPAMALGKADFRIYDNGREQTITDFERHVTTPAPASALRGKDTEPGIAAAKPAPETGALLNRKFFILIDCDANDLAGIAKARNAALRFIDHQAQPGDGISVLSYSSMTGLTSHSSLTTDHAQARTAVSRIREIPGRSVESAGGADTGGITIVGTGKDGEAKIIGTPKVRTSPFHVFIDRMTDLAGALRYIPGYKNVLFFSWGRPMPGNDGESVRRMDAMTKAFATANAPFFTINTETPNPWNSKGSGGMDTLDLMAKKTGGKAYYEVGAVHYFDEIAPQIQELTRNYYVLGYPVKETWDGKFHKIKVELVSGDFKIQAQAGYNNPKPFSDFSDLEKELHLFDLALSEKTGPQAPQIFSMATAVFRPAQAESSRILLITKLPSAVVDRFRNRDVELVTLVLDEQDLAVDRIRLTPKLAGYAGKNAVLAVDSEVPPGSYRCRIILRDLETGDSAMAYARANVPAPTSAGLRLETPLLLAPGGPAVSIDDVAKRSSIWKDYYGFDPSSFALLASEVPPGLSKLVVIIPCKMPEAARADLVFRASLIDVKTGTGRSLPLTTISRKANAGTVIVLSELSLEGVRAGTYRLYLHAEEATTKLTAYAQIPLIIH